MGTKLAVYRMDYINAMKAKRAKHISKKSFQKAIRNFFKITWIILNSTTGRSKANRATDPSREDE